MTTETVSIPPAQKNMEDIVALCKRRGFVYPASEIYGGINGFWDYGPLGTALKNNIRDWWWKCTVECPPLGPDGEPLSIVGLDSSIIQNPKAWVASGHVGGFNDPMVDCTESKKRYRADHLYVLRHKDEGPAGHMYAYIGGDKDSEANAAKKLSKQYKVDLPSPDLHVTSLVQISTDEFHRIVGPDTKKAGTLTEPREFNLMFETYVGATATDDDKAYLRPETAQGIFLNYKNVLDTMRVKVPFGIAQIGKSFRNEVTPRNFIFRSREFEQMEMEWFCAPGEAPQWYEFWKEERMKWWLSLGIDPANLRFRDHDADELAHYSKMCVDVEYMYPFTAPGFGELEGVAHRGCFDLTQHQEHSGQKMEYVDQARNNDRYVPNVIEPASGLTRAVIVMLCEAYTPTPERSGAKEMLKLKPKFAPIKAGIFPLVNKEGMPGIAQELYMDLRQKFTCQYDAKQSIGKRYARMDEAGTPFCFTVDGDTATDQAVTVRDRDTAQQHRLALDQVETFLEQMIGE